eukprot:TRINITY_DN9705_c0_g1_i1.p2 TRINITY_DN9705_c0_g1~~TRINITY_DN9705_c0_g1_i1.p2  ORF type:complete len:244 (+),score=45.60 TRINITY_DN9705_c0_g1_i1:649-1380(+)
MHRTPPSFYVNVVVGAALSGPPRQRGTQGGSSTHALGQRVQAVAFSNGVMKLVLPEAELEEDLGGEGQEDEVLLDHPTQAMELALVVGAWFASSATSQATGHQTARQEGRVLGEGHLGAHLGRVALLRNTGSVLRVVWMGIGPVTVRIKEGLAELVMAVVAVAAEGQLRTGGKVRKRAEDGAGVVVAHQEAKAASMAEVRLPRHAIDVVKAVTGPTHARIRPLRDTDVAQSLCGPLFHPGNRY